MSSYRFIKPIDKEAGEPAKSAKPASLLKAYRAYKLYRDYRAFMGFKVCKVFQIREDSTYFVIQFVTYLYIITICKLFLLVFPLKEKESGKKIFLPA